MEFRNLWKTACFYANFLVQWLRNGERPLMNPEQAREFGELVRAQREALGLTRQDLAARMEVRDSTITRIEQGKFAAPRPDKLARLAEQLRLDLADVFAMVGYIAPRELPRWQQYLQTKYPDLPEAAVDELHAALVDIAARFGVEMSPEEVPIETPVPRVIRPTSERLVKEFGEDFA